MTTVYSIKHTDGIRTIPIQPGTLNSTTDLQLYGQGTLQWGAGVDQNQLRLLENYAVEEKAGSPGEPQTEIDIGITGTGVNNPTVGQSWYNLTDFQLYTYTGADWVIGGSIFASAPGAEPANPVVGTLWYNTTTNQLNVYNGATFESTAEDYLPLAGGTMLGNIAMGGLEVTGLPAVPSATGAASKEYVDNELSSAIATAGTDFVNVTGDTMTGVLQFDSNMFLYEGIGNVAAGADIRLVGSGLITAGNNLYLVSDDGNGASGDIIFAKGSQVITGAETELLTIQNDGEIRAQTPAYETIAANNDQNLVNKKYVDDAVSGAAAGVAVAWAAYNGSSNSLLDSFGIASVSKLGAGNYNFNLSGARPNTNYCVVVSAIDSNSTHGQNAPVNGQSNRLQLYTIRASVSSTSTFNVRTKYNDQIVRTVNDGDDDFEIPVTIKSLTDWSYITVVVYDN